MQIHGGNIRDVSRKYTIKENKIIDFSSNINPLGFPKAIHAIIPKELSKIVSYPDSQSTQLKEAIAKKLGLDEKTILVGNGSTELIYLIPRVFKPKRALIPVPTFNEYEKSLLSVNCELRYLHLKAKEKFRLNIDETVSSLRKGEILYVCNPNNPTGVLLSNNEVRTLVAKAEKKGVMVVVDEAFMDFSENNSVIDEVRIRDNLIVIRSLTKFFAIPGLRLGYLVASQKLVQEMSVFKEPWSVNILAQKAGEACFNDDSFALRTKRFIAKERTYLISELGKIKGLKVYDSSTNYLLLKIVRQGLSSGRLYEGLARQGLLIRDCRSFKGLGNSYIRVAVKRRKENTLLVKHLKNIVGK
jgi:threonine-phosphate decarboxylase